MKKLMFSVMLALSAFFAGAATRLTLDNGINIVFEGCADGSVRFEALGKKMTKQTASKLLHDGKVELKGCKSQKTGKTYDTTVVMSVDENKRAVFRLSFEKGEGRNGKSKNKKD